MWANKNLPAFGPLQGLKVVHATQSVAGPFGPQLMAEYGADVLWLENPMSPDVTRFSPGYSIDGERRNMRNLALNIPSEQGREVLGKILADADVFLESYKGGQMERWGLTDEVLWSYNPKLVICHVSGFGQSGVQEYVERPSYDMIAQAFSGYMWGNGTPDAVFPTGPYAAEYMTAMFATTAVLAALYSVNRTGKGESIDVAQIEAMMKVQLGAVSWLTDQMPFARSGFPQPQAGVGCFKCADGEFVQVALAGGGVLKKALAFMGFDISAEPWASAGAILLIGTPEGDEYHNRVLEYLASHTSDEAHAALVAAGLTAQKVNQWSDVEADPHVAARQIIQQVKSVKGVDVRHVGVVPKFKNNPGRTWRPAPYIGQDNEEILGQIGYTDEQIAALYDGKIIGHDPEMKFTYPYTRPGA